MAAAIAPRLAAGGHGIRFLGRDGDKAAELAERFGPGASHGSLGEPLGEETAAVVVAVRYTAVAEVLAGYGEGELAGKVLIDLTNPLNPAYDGLLVEGDSSAAERLAATVPDSTPVVKAFNTTFHGRLAAGEAGGVPLDVFIAGDDAEAKSLVARLVEDGGMRPIDVGELYRARALEGFQLLHIMAQGTLGSGFQTQIKFLS